MLKFAAIVLATGGLVAGQAPQQAPAETAGARKERAAKTKKDEARERRDHALFLLTGLADESAKFQDATLRARVQARAADTLWRVDRDRAVALFRKSWASAQTAYEDAKRRNDEEMRKQRESGGASVSFGFPDVREEVLRLVAARDRSLGEEFFAKLAESRELEAASASPGERTADGLMNPPDAIAKRLRLAEDLLDRDDVETALQFAEPALGAVTVPAIQFLTNLREKDPSAADAWYGRLLARAAADPASDANTVSVLSSYAFTPYVYIVVDPSGSKSSSAMRRGDAGSPREPSSESRTAFLTVAAQILTRPLAPEQLASTTAGLKGTLSQMARLMSLFEQHAAHLLEPVRARQIALATEGQESPPEEVDLLGGQIQGPGAGDQQRNDPLERALERVRTATTNEQRDLAYAQAALAAIGKRDERANDFVNSIADHSLRRDLRAYADFAALNAAVRGKEHERALQLTRSGEITHIQRVWAITAIARAVAKEDRERAVSLLEEALAAARRVDLNDPDRPRGILAVAAVFVDVDASRVREYVAEAVQAANKAEGFTGEDGTLRTVFRMKGMTFASSESAPGFDLAGVFAHLAQTDLEEATILAKGFEGEAPRATALLTVARTILADQKAR